MDREKVITHLQIIHTWAEFARERDLQFFTAKHLEDIAQWADDALELLKAQRETIDELISADKALKLLKEQPEIVRCKGCKHAEEDCEIAFHFGEKDDWFCADGEGR